MLKWSGGGAGVVPGGEEEATLFSPPGKEIRNRYRVRAPLTHPTVLVLVRALGRFKVRARWLPASRWMVDRYKV